MIFCKLGGKWNTGSTRSQLLGSVMTAKSELNVVFVRPEISELTNIINLLLGSHDLWRYRF